MAAYPTSFPMVEAGKLFGYLKDRSIAENKADAALCGWTVQGYLQGVLIGNPDPQFGAEPLGPSDEQVLNALVKQGHDVLAQQRVHGELAFGSDESTNEFINVILPLIIRLLEKFLDK